MMRVWDDVNARVRGLGSRLLGLHEIERLAEAETVQALGRELERRGYPTSDAQDLSPRGLERAVRRRAQTLMRIVVRWCGERRRALAVLLEDEDRRSVRALVRGAVAGAPYDERLAGLVPTPSLPSRALEELSRLSTVSEMAATLMAWRHPFGQALLGEADRALTDLFLVELSVNRAFATRARAGARRGGPVLRAFAEESLDLENASAALVLARNASDAEPSACFLEGGRRLTRDRFERAARSQEPIAVLAPAFSETALDAAFARDNGELELDLFRLRLRELVRRARLEPLTPLPLLTFVLRLRAEAIDLRTLIWARALGAPPGQPELRLVSA